MILAGKVAMITGAARGIGLAVAKAYVAEGACVVLADIESQKATEEAYNLGDAALAVELDVTQQQSIEQAINTVIAHFGRIDILINNAALFTAAPIVDISYEEYNRIFAVNVQGVLFTMQAVAKRMISAGQGGCIINMASQAGRRGEPLVAVYCASKAAVISLTQSAGLNLIQQGIRVNAIAPGVIDGDHWNEVDALFAKHENKPLGQKKQEVSATVPIGRMGTAEDVAGMAVFLASSDARYIVAQTYNVDGGNWMS